MNVSARNTECSKVLSSVVPPAPAQGALSRCPLSSNGLLSSLAFELVFTTGESSLASIFRADGFVVSWFTFSRPSSYRRKSRTLYLQFPDSWSTSSQIVLKSISQYPSCGPRETYQ